MSCESSLPQRPLARVNADGSGILINAATVGYGQQPTFAIEAPGQRPLAERIKYEVTKRTGVLRRALEAEGMLRPWLEDDPEALAEWEKEQAEKSPSKRTTTEAKL